MSFKNVQTGKSCLTPEFRKMVIWDPKSFDLNVFEFTNLQLEDFNILGHDPRMCFWIPRLRIQSF